MLSCGIKHNNLMLVQLEMITIYLLIYISGYCQNICSQFFQTYSEAGKDIPIFTLEL